MNRNSSVLAGVYEPIQYMVNRIELWFVVSASFWFIIFGCVYYVASFYFAWGHKRAKAAAYNSATLVLLMAVAITIQVVL